MRLSGGGADGERGTIELWAQIQGRKRLGVMMPLKCRTDKSGHTHTEMRHDTCGGERHTCSMFNTLMANVGLPENQNVMRDGQITYCTKVLWLRRNLPLHAQVKFGIIKFIP